ncbi:hypothetical protein CFC21_011265, partial [Triticum aestivum]
CHISQELDHFQMNKNCLNKNGWNWTKKAIQLRYRLGISGNIKMNELTKYQIDQIEQMIAQDHVVHWELKRGERADIERLISISRYRGIRHQDGSPLRGQRTHTNARTARKQIRK